MAAHACDAIDGTIHLHALTELWQGGGECELGDTQAKIGRFNEATNIELLLVAIATDQHEQVDAVPPRLHSMLVEKLLQVVENVGFEGHAVAGLSKTNLTFPFAQIWGA